MSAILRRRPGCMGEDDYAMAVEAIHRFMDIAAGRDAVLDDLSERILDRLQTLSRTEGEES